MSFTAKEPLTIDGVSFPFVGVSLVTSPGFTETSVGGRVVLNLDPYRIDEDGKVIRPVKTVTIEDADGNPQSRVVVDNSYRTTKIYSDVFQAAADSPALGAALAVISAGIQGFISEDLGTMAQSLGGLVQALGANANG